MTRHAKATTIQWRTTKISLENRTVLVPVVKSVDDTIPHGLVHIQVVKGGNGLCQLKHLLCWAEDCSQPELAVSDRSSFIPGKRLAKN